MSKTIKDMRKVLLKKGNEIGEGKISGYDFDKEFDAKKFFDSFKDTGFQATNLGEAIDIVKEMQKEKARIFLGFTSNMVSCGVRETINYLVKNKLVHFLVTTTGGIEEDVIKAHKDFLHGRFDADGAWLRKNGVNRTGNIFIPNDRYVWYESFASKVIKKIYDEQKKTGRACSGAYFLEKLGEAMEGLPRKKESFVYWAYKNKIPIVCIPLHDGATGDHIYMFRKNHPDFDIDMIKDLELIYDTVLEDEKSGAIIIGGSVPKHMIMNAFMIREGIEYTVYINTGYEGEGSNAGASPDEAKSWGKANSNKKCSKSVKVWGEASIIFPLLVAAGFKLK